ncbi:hypothetical protein KCP70_10130 [Salmonella enterica subsp. enterica]|nr:hypothetical protein KCP70_10130 [Salmonella enterica subsp. enterica]
MTGFMLIDTAIWGEEGNFIDALVHMILPAMWCSAQSRWPSLCGDPFVDAGRWGVITSVPHAPKG